MTIKRTPAGYCVGGVRRSAAIAVRLTEETKESIDKISRRTNVSRTQLVEQAIKEFVARKEKERRQKHD